MHDRFRELTEGAYQDRNELDWLYKHHLVPHKPTRVIEIGVAAGGTTRLFLDVCGAKGQVVGIDISKDLIAPDVLEDPRFRLYLGDSSSKAIVEQVKAFMPECDLLLIDGDHTEAGVLADTECYLPLVREGGLVIWHDVQLESPSGIKGTWYRNLKKRYPGATDYFVDPHNTGYGLWYKRAAGSESPVDATALKAAENLAERRRAVTADPRDAGSWVALLHLLEKDPGTMRADIMQALLLAAGHCLGRPDCEAEYQQITGEIASRVCRTLSRSQRWDELPALVEQLLDRDPNLIELALNEMSDGLFWLSQRTHDLSAHGPAYQRAYQRALARAGDRGQAARARMIRTLRYERDWDAAAKLARQSLAVGQDYDVKKELAGSLLDGQQLPEAQRLYRELHEARPNDLDVAYHLVASAPPGDALAARLKNDVVALARKGREPLALDADAALKVRDRLEQFGYVIVKGAFNATTVARLRDWSSSKSACLTSDGGRLGAEARQLLIAEIQQNSLHAAAHGYVGDYYMHPDSFARTMGAEHYSAWHQDGRTSNQPWRYCTFWLALDPCGADLPGLELVTYPFKAFCPAGPAKAPRAPYNWSMNEDLIIPETRFAPVLEPGDLLIFNKYVAHATQLTPGASGKRRSVDFRLHSKRVQD